jgi:hypothetical protein
MTRRWGRWCASTLRYISGSSRNSYPVASPPDTPGDLRRRFAAWAGCGQAAVERHLAPDGQVYLTVDDLVITTDDDGNWEITKRGYDNVTLVTVQDERVWYGHVMTRRARPRSSRD